MASIYGLKPKFQSLLRPSVHWLARVGVTANQVTIFALLLSLATGHVIRKNGGRTLLLLPIVLFVRMALNAMDGMLAREHNQKSALGAILNELGDVVADIGLYLPLAGVPGFNPWLVVAVVLLSVLSEMTGVIGVQIGASRRYDGPLGKSDRAFLFGLLGLLLGLRAGIGPAIPYVLFAMILFLALTIINRARAALLEVRARAAEKCQPACILWRASSRRSRVRLAECKCTGRGAHRKYANAFTLRIIRAIWILRCCGPPSQPRFARGLGQ